MEAKVMKTWRVSANVVGWVKAETHTEASAKFVREVQPTGEETPSDPDIEAISVEDFYDISEVEEATDR